jgi:hypothetical protein
MSDKDIRGEDRIWLPDDVFDDTLANLPAEELGFLRESRPERP